MTPKYLNCTAADGQSSDTLKCSRQCLTAILAFFANLPDRLVEVGVFARIFSIRNILHCVRIFLAEPWTRRVRRGGTGGGGHVLCVADCTSEMCYTSLVQACLLALHSCVFNRRVIDEFQGGCRRMLIMAPCRRMLITAPPRKLPMKPIVSCIVDRVKKACYNDGTTVTPEKSHPFVQQKRSIVETDIAIVGMSGEYQSYRRDRVDVTPSSQRSNSDSIGFQPGDATLLQDTNHLEGDMRTRLQVECR